MIALRSLGLLSLCLTPTSAFVVPLKSTAHYRIVRRFDHGRTKPKRKDAPSVSSALQMSFLPPGNDKQQGLGDIAGSILTILVVGAFLASPLGAIVFAIFNSFLALLILLPLTAVVGFNVWQYLNTVSGACPNCGSPVRVMKDQTPSFCFTCGSVIQAKDDEIFLANTNTNMNYAQVEKEEESVFSGWFDDLSGVQRKPPSPKSNSSSNVIDVEIEADDRE